MALAVALNKRSKTSGVLIAKFTLTPSGSYSTNGDSVDFAPKVGFTNRQPDYVDINGVAGFTYAYKRSTKKMLVFCNTAGGADQPLGELSAGAYPAGITGDTIEALCFWIPTPGLT